jgi:hypothetical protein
MRPITLSSLAFFALCGCNVPVTDPGPLDDWRPQVASSEDDEEDPVVEDDCSDDESDIPEDPEEESPIVEDEPENLPPIDCEEGEHTPGDMVLRTVEEARAFGELYTSASRITIEGHDLTNLDDLRCLESAWMIEMVDTAVERVELPSLTQLQYLWANENSQLRVVSLPLAEVADVRLNDNPRVRKLQLPAAESVRHVAITSNDKLVQVDLRSVTEAGNVSLDNNPKLAKLRMKHLEESSSSLLVTNTGLQSLDLPSLTTVGGHLIVQDNSALEEVVLDSLEWVELDIRVQDNSSLLEVQLPSLTMLARNLDISRNDSLTDVRVPLLKAVGNPDTAEYLSSSLTLVDNPELSDVSFDNLVAVGRMLYIGYNDEIMDLGGFSTLRFVRGQLRLENNVSLRDMTGLNGLESVGMAVGHSGTPGHFIVRDNPRMPIEQAETLAYDIIGEDNIGGRIIIEDVLFGGGF